MGGQICRFSCPVLSCSLFSPPPSVCVSCGRGVLTHDRLHLHQNAVHHLFGPQKLMPRQRVVTQLVPQFETP